jgi:uncharacterized membrane protein
MTTTAVEPGVLPMESSEPATTVTTSRSRGKLFVYAFTALYAVVFIAAATSNYVFYFAPRFDLGNMVQVVWSTAHGHFLRISDPSGVDMSRLGAHFDPFLATLVPLWWIWSNPLVLFGAQAIAVSSGALPVYWLARKHLDDRFAVAFAIAFLLYAPTQFNTFSPVGIHAVSFAIPLILYAVWFLDEDRLALFAVFALAAATTKEEIAASVGGLGIWYALRRGRRRAGVSIFAAGVAFSLINFLVVIPHYAPTGQSPFAGRYTDVGGTPTGMLRVAVTDPGAFVHQVSSGHKLFFLVLVFAPFLGLWALEPLMLVGALPDLAVNLLSSNDKQTTIFYQYTAGITPFVVAASVLGAARLRKRGRVPAALLVVIGCFAILSPIVSTVTILTSRSPDEVNAMRRAIRLIPPGAPTSAAQSLGGNVSTRHVIAVFPSVERANWVIVGPLTSIDRPRAFRHRLAELHASPHWTQVFDQSGIEVFERVGDAAPAP